jgi:hypothetical protein
VGQLRHTQKEEKKVLTNLPTLFSSDVLNCSASGRTQAKMSSATKLEFTPECIRQAAIAVLKVSDVLVKIP